MIIWMRRYDDTFFLDVFIRRLLRTDQSSQISSSFSCIAQSGTSTFLLRTVLLWTAMGKRGNKLRLHKDDANESLTVPLLPCGDGPDQRTHFTTPRQLGYFSFFLSGQREDCLVSFCNVGSKEAKKSRPDFSTDIV